MQWLDTIFAHCEALPDHPALETMQADGTARRYTRAELLGAVAYWIGQLGQCERTGTHPLKVGLVTRNGPEWVVADLALLAAGAVEVPVPLAFSSDQALHLLESVDLCLVDERGAERLQEWFAQAARPCPAIRMIDLDALPAPVAGLRRPTLPAGEAVCKIIHTSGTTSRPKGVMIRGAGLDQLLASLRRRVPTGRYARYLSIVPLSLLIEQVTAVYMTLLDGGTVVFLPRQVPLLGEAGGSTRTVLEYLPRAAPSAMTLPPSMVEALLVACRQQPDEDPAARNARLFGTSDAAFLACGGAPVAPVILEELRQFGIPVYEGYGLSENSSVVSWNAPDCFKPGTVGKPLDHVSVRLSDDGELLIKSASLFAGYANADPSSCEVDADGWLHTGDLAQIDRDGFLRIFGRKKNLIITANGRNVSPEWVESAYKSLDCVEQAVLYGDGLDELSALFVLAPGTDAQWARKAIHEFGLLRLSEVERVNRIYVVPSTPAFYATYFTVTGRPRRELIWEYIHTFKHQEDPCLTV
ncbi:AMP-binding protein [Chitiniphilus purpureus]|uniref:AMP-binding protein n=1 Tax=Chitiniphilus purpureus TaxID=2981137 RepID=A0ABY6DUG3_9NEIS|nr:AMP-binding protein [Chitiniphilus sp. CD1]UXY17141.1 AMP-binding protein [Chitiniphilus sp. CD1]